MVDQKVVGCSWITLPAGTWRQRAKGRNPEPESRCQLEVDVAFDKFITHEPEGEWAKVAPLRILSFDIECAGRKGVFPEATQDPVIQIANMVIRQGEHEPFLRNVFTLNTCAPIVGSQVNRYFPRFLQFKIVISIFVLGPQLPTRATNVGEVERFR